MMAKLSPLEWVVAVLFGLAIYFGIIACVWVIWCFAWSSLWPEGPSTLIDPPFLPFVGATVLVVWLKSFLGVRK
jgi:hypothetical protein